jgi:hypothetical protein
MLPKKQVLQNRYLKIYHFNVNLLMILVNIILSINHKFNSMVVMLNFISLVFEVMLKIYNLNNSDTEMTGKVTTLINCLMHKLFKQYHQITKIWSRISSIWLKNHKH